MATFTKFAQEIKKKYPEYANVDDAKLAKAFIEKYPEYGSQVTWSPDYTEYERKADISTTPITTRDGKVVPVNTSQLGADRVHLSDVIALQKEMDTEADKEAGKKTISGYYTPVKINNGKAKPQEFKTYTFEGDRGQPVQFTGVSKEDAYEQAVASGAITRGRTSEQRKEAAGQAAMRTGTPVNTMEWAAETAPYSAQAQLSDAGIGDKAIAYAKDVFSLPGRGISTAYDYIFNPERSDIGRTSEESESEDRTMESIITDPVTGAVTMLAPAVELGAPAVASKLVGPLGKMYTKTPALLKPAMKYTLSKPTTAVKVVGEAGLATGAGATLDENYGGENVIWDVVGSTVVPALGPVIRKVSKSVAQARIASIMKKAGYDLDNASIERIYNDVYAMADVPSVPESALKSAAKAEQSKLGKLMSDIAPGSTIDKNLLGEARDDIAASRITGKISDDVADARLGEVDAFAERQAKIDADYATGEMSDATYRKRMVDLIKTYGQSPELKDLLQGALSTASRSEVAQNREIANIPFERGSQEYIDAANAIYDKYWKHRQIDPADWKQYNDEYRAFGDIASGKVRTSPELKLSEGLLGIPKQIIRAGSPTVIDYAGYGSSRIPIQLPTLQRMYMYDRQKDNLNSED